jgi:hypothetical protein
VISKSKPIFPILIAIMLLGVLLLYFFWNPSNNNFFPKCPLYSLTGIYCPGCGSQRAMHQIIHGNIIEGLRHNYLIALLGIVLLYQALLFMVHKLYNKSFYNILHQSLTIKIILVLILVFWLLRNIRFYPFTELAP